MPGAGRDVGLPSSIGYLCEERLPCGCSALQFFLSAPHTPRSCSSGHPHRDTSVLGGWGFFTTRQPRQDVSWGLGCGCERRGPWAAGGSESPVSKAQIPGMPFSGCGVLGRLLPGSQLLTPKVESDHPLVESCLVRPSRDSARPGISAQDRGLYHPYPRTMPKGQETRRPRHPGCLVRFTVISPSCRLPRVEVFLAL